MMQSDNLIQTDLNADKITKILPKLQMLDDALLREAPQIRNHLLEINEDLRQYPDLTHLLTDEQIKPIYTAIRKMTDVEITTRAASKRTVAPKLDAQDKALLKSLL